MYRRAPSPAPLASVVALTVVPVAGVPVAGVSVGTPCAPHWSVRDRARQGTAMVRSRRYAASRTSFSSHRR
uniref:Secreted protein n=1 Tax=Anopheles darlingi TaxID=43151 RepID=A0A2M4DRB5_ANODA